jgi:hypothetical protein
MRTYECEETAFKAWLATFDGTAIRQSPQNCVLARFFQSEGVEFPRITPPEGGSAPNWILKAGRLDEMYVLPSWATQVAIAFDRNGEEMAVTADELREEFA